VDEFEAKMKPIIRKIRPKDFEDIDPAKQVDWNEIINEPPKKRN
jgi:hypothetical protein